MPDWTQSMHQTFEYYIVDPGTWKDQRLLEGVKSCTINRDATVDTLGSATIDVEETINENYVRVYLITNQNGIKEKHPLGTFLVQTPSLSFNGKIQNVSLDAYTPLLELKESPPPIGYSVLKGENILDLAYRLTIEKSRAPVVRTFDTTTLLDDFVANTDDTWLKFLMDFLANAKYTFGLDELGRILYTPKQDAASLQPMCTFNDDNSSILYPTISMDHDLYGVPNVVEIIYSKGNVSRYARAVNDNPNSLTSTISRGREIVYRINDPELAGNPSESHIIELADQTLRELSSLEYTVSYTHGYYPTRLHDCVRLNYQKAGITNVKARIIGQTIKCVPGTPVTEKAVFTTNLWR